MKRILKVAGYLSLVFLVTASLAYYQRAELMRWYFELPPFETEYVSSTQEVPMRDGVELETHIFTPEGEGPWPTVLIRDPYSSNKRMCKAFARYNYACVHQDVRGRYASEGDWYPLINERNDGLDTLDWLVKQPFQNGNIATYGGSYVGAVQWAMIDEMPEQVKTVVADVSHGDWYKIAQKNGHFVQGVISDWALGLHNSETSLNEFVAQKPAVKANEMFLGGKKLWLHNYMSNENKTDGYWGAEYYQTVRSAHKKASMPVLMMGGWHDFFIDGQFDVFEQLPKRGESLLVVRNGGHGANSLSDYGLHVRTTLQWLRRQLKGEEVKALPVGGYLLQDNVDGSLRHVSQWPDSKTEKTFYLEGMDRSKMCDGGSLQISKNVGRKRVSYVYDPEHPVPSRGGSYSFNNGIAEQGSDFCARSDVLSFVSDTFENSVTISGVMQVALKVSSDAKDSAFTVKVQEKLADGTVLNIRDDITSLSFSNGALSRQHYEPNSVVEVVFDLTPIQWTLRPGSSIRLDVSSSNYPDFNAHPNTDQLWSVLSETEIANQTLIAGSLKIPLQ